MFFWCYRLTENWVIRFLMENNQNNHFKVCPKTLVVILFYREKKQEKKRTNGITGNRTNNWEFDNGLLALPGIEPGSRN